MDSNNTNEYELLNDSDSINNSNYNDGKNMSYSTDNIGNSIKETKEVDAIDDYNIIKHIKDMKDILVKIKSAYEKYKKYLSVSELKRLNNYILKRKKNLTSSKYKKYLPVDKTKKRRKNNKKSKEKNKVIKEYNSNISLLNKQHEYIQEKIKQLNKKEKKTSKSYIKHKLSNVNKLIEFLSIFVTYLSSDYSKNIIKEVINDDKLSFIFNNLYEDISIEILDKEYVISGIMFELYIKIKMSEKKQKDTKTSYKGGSYYYNNPNKYNYRQSYGQSYGQSRGYLYDNRFNLFDTNRTSNKKYSTNIKTEVDSLYKKIVSIVSDFNDLDKLYIELNKLLLSNYKSSETVNKLLFSGKVGFFNFRKKRTKKKHELKLSKRLNTIKTKLPYNTDLDKSSSSNNSNSSNNNNNNINHNNKNTTSSNNNTNSNSNSIKTKKRRRLF